jgi:hypothetical protein
MRNHDIKSPRWVPYGIKNRHDASNCANKLKNTRMMEFDALEMSCHKDS